jgi:hypothetical protein
MTTPNAELAYRVLDHIDADPISLMQRVWISQVACGTVACFAGWTCLLAGDQPTGFDEAAEAEYVRAGPEGDTRYIPERAAELLGIDYDEADDFGNTLFNPNTTRDGLVRKVAEIFGPRPCPNCPPGYDCERGHYATTGGEPR